MPLFRQSLLQKNTPKTITLPALYKHLFKIENLNTGNKLEIMKALQKSGYDYSTATKILSGHSLNIAKAKEVAYNLSQAGLRGFAKNDAHKLVDKYVRKEAIRNKNLSGRRRELMLESRQEEVNKNKTSSLRSIKNSPTTKTSGLGISKPKLRF